NGFPTESTYSGTGNGAATTKTTFNSLGLLEKIVYPLGNSVTYTYDTNNVNIRSRANLLKEEQDAGPRGGPKLTRTIPTYDPKYNLPNGQQTDFNGKSITIALTSDGFDIDTITYQNAGVMDFDYNE